MPTRKPDIVQVKDPRTGMFVKIDRARGKILAYKKSLGPFKNVQIVHVEKP
jgi:hypothetical protein